jgi:AcrR family transcriptional regulator
LKRSATTDRGAHPAETSSRANGAPTAPNDARRVPLQERSRRRVERIVDAASQVFAEVGYDTATTEEIAARAGTSIGSLYQFFPNKLALFNAVAARHFEKARALFERLLDGAASRAWQDVLDDAVDGFAALDREPGFRAVWTNWQLSTEFLVAGTALNHEFARRVALLLAANAPHLSPAKRNLVATAVVEVMSAMLLAAERSGPRLRGAMTRETKLLLRRYLAPYAPGAPKR